MSRRRSRPSMLRGIAWAVAAAVAGYALPFVAIMGMFYVRAFVVGLSRDEIDDALLRMSDRMRPQSAGLGCAIVFGLAAIVNFVPPVRLGYVRAVMFSGLAVIGGFFVGTIWTAAFQLQPRTYNSDPWRWYRVVATLALPVVYCLLHTMKRCAEQGNEAEPGSTSYATELTVGANPNAESSLLPH